MGSGSDGAPQVVRLTFWPAFTPCHPWSAHVLYFCAVAGHGRGVAVCEVLGSLMVGGAPLSSSKQRRLLAALAIAHGGVVSSDRLGDVVWDGEPPDTDNALQTYVSRLRTVLGAGSVVRRPPGYALVLPVEAVDAWRFESLVDEARHRSPGEALELLDEALGLWRGAAYAEFADDEFARAEAVRLEELRASAAVARLDALLDLGRADDAAADAVRLIEADPYRESVWERRMRALHASGRTVDAVRAFREYRTVLADETGLEPSADLVALERALLASPSLSGPVDGRGALPSPLTSLVGRDAACDELVELVAAQRVVTLVGPGGVGKTRLAVEVARVHRRSHWFAGGLCRAGRRRCRRCRRRGRPRPRPRLKGPIRWRRCAVLSSTAAICWWSTTASTSSTTPPTSSLRWFRSAPSLRVLATSRTPLGVAGEQRVDGGSASRPRPRPRGSGWPTCRTAGRRGCSSNGPATQVS